MVAAARRNTAGAKGATHICVPAWDYIQLPLAPRFNFGLFPSLQHQNIGTWAFVRK